MSYHEIEQAIRQLAQTERGRQAMADLSAFFDNGGCSLDAENRRAVCTLILGGFGEFGGTVPAELRDYAVKSTPHPEPEPGMGVLDSREVATILAALRHWQREIQHPQRGSVQALLDDVATDGGEFAELSADEIDALCERINLGGAS